MGAIFVQDDDMVDYTPVADTATGAVIVQNDLIGVALRPLPANVLGSLAVEGLFDFPKSTAGGSAIGSGATVYWNVAAQQATTTSAGNKLIGKTTRAAADADATVRVRLFQ